MSFIPKNSFRLTAVSAFIYGYVSIVLIIEDSNLHSLYQKEVITFILLAATGSLLGSIVSTWVHELGHFFTARVVGGLVFRIVIGTGNVLARFQFFGTPCEMRESLVNGVVSYGLANKKKTRLNLAMVIAGGPIASIFLLTALVELCLLVWPKDPVDNGWAFLVPVLASGSLSCFRQLLAVLTPRTYTYAGRKMQTDALRLLKIPWLTEADIQKKVNAASNLKKIDFSTWTLQQALNRASAAPNDQTAIRTLIYFLEQVSDTRVLHSYGQLLDLFPHENDRAQTIYRYLGRSLEWDEVTARPHEMDQLSTELLNSKPDETLVFRIRGAVLVDIGRVEEGKTILLEVLEKTESKVDKLYTSAFLALAEQKLGNQEAALAYAENAIKLDPKSLLIRRLVKAGMVPKPAEA